MDQPTPLTFLDDTGSGFTIEQDGTPVGPAVSTLDVVGAAVTYDESSDIHTLTVTGATWYTVNSGNPLTNDLGVAGDFALDIDTDDIYQKSADVTPPWVWVANIQGAPGPRGATGATGPGAGAQWWTGDDFVSPTAIDPGTGINFRWDDEHSTLTIEATGTLPNPLTIPELSLQVAPAAGSESLQAYSGGLVSRAGASGGSALDCAVVPAPYNLSNSKAPKIARYAGSYSQTSGSMATTLTFSTVIFGQNPPANREFVASLTLCQRLDDTATSGWAGTYLITAPFDGSGNLLTSSVWINQIGTVGPGAFPVVDADAVNNTKQFMVHIDNSETYSGNLTGYFEIEIAWVGA